MILPTQAAPASSFGAGTMTFSPVFLHSWVLVFSLAYLDCHRMPVNVLDHILLLRCHDRRALPLALDEGVCAGG